MSGRGETTEASPSARRRRIASWFVAGLTFLIAGAGIGWAGATVLTQPPDILDSTSYTYVAVVSGEVEAAMAVNTVAAWTPQPLASNLATGTVTTVNVSPGDEANVGSVLYTVNLRPVVIAQGSIPAFRALSRGTSGADVSQLQTMLSSLGFYGYDVDGDFDYATQQAVEEWQESLDVEDDGIVQSGDIVYVPALPTRISLDTSKVRPGTVLAGGEEVVRGLPATPAFSVPVTATQAASIPLATRVEITGPGGEVWQGFVTEQVASTKDDSVSLILGGKDGVPICGAACVSVPITDESLLRSRAVTVEPVTGLTVPSAALASKADGSVVVIDSADVEHTVSVVTSARGMSVIDGAGISEGTRVRVPAGKG